MRYRRLKPMHHLALTVLATKLLYVFVGAMQTQLMFYTFDPIVTLAPKP